MSDALTATNPILKWLGRITIAVAVAYFSAASVASASGLGDGSDERTIAGIIVGFLTLTALVFAETQLRRLFATLAWTSRRPSTVVVVTLIVAGVLCVIAAVILQLVGGVDSASFDGSTVDATAQISFGSRSSIMVTVTTVVILMIAAILIGLGVWGSIPPSERNDDDRFEGKTPAKSDALP